MSCNCFEDGPPWDGEVCYSCIGRDRNDGPDKTENRRFPGLYR